ncbi:hypothetical protein FRC07_015130 [Ceratobasidium sp. 392]|nr:hypothetical protein FRC07_015130 [Ceratobasidium sp. 392]
MSKQIDRCPKQLSIWLSNRRQGLRDARVKNGAVFKTDDDKREFLWSKYRSASKKASKTPEAASTPADTSMESGSELTRASSVETAQYSTSEATTPFEYDSKSINAQPTPRASKFDFLLHAVNLATVEVEQNDEICQALLGLRCA